MTDEEELQSALSVEGRIILALSHRIAALRSELETRTAELRDAERMILTLNAALELHHQ